MARPNVHDFNFLQWVKGLPAQEYARYNQGTADVADAGSSMVANMAAQPFEGVYGLIRGLRNADYRGAGDSLLHGMPVSAMGKLIGSYSAKDAAEGVEDAQQTLGPHLAPETQGGQRLLGTLGNAVGTVTKPLGMGVDKVGEYSPALGAGILAGSQLIDPTKVLGKLARGVRGARAAQGAADAVRAAEVAAPAMRAPTQLTAPPDSVRAALLDAIQKTEAPKPKPEPVEPAAPLRTDPRSDQFLIPGLPALTPTEGVQQARNSKLAAMLREVDNPGPEAAADVTDARDGLRQAQQHESLSNAQDSQAQIDALRGQRTPGEDISTELPREEQLLNLKLHTDIPFEGGYATRSAGSSRHWDLPMQGRQGVEPMDLPAEAFRPVLDRADQVAGSRSLLRNLRDVQRFVNEPRDWEPERTIPDWARQLTLDPTTQAGGHHPAGGEWWIKQPEKIPESVGEFLRSIRAVDPAFTYGAMPEGLDTIEEFAQHFGDRAGKRINVDFEGAMDGDEAKIEREKEHGYGEPMRDRYGDWKEEQKTYERGASPMYDNQGNVIKATAGFDEKGNPIKEPAIAQGDEPKFTEWGDPKMREILSEGGEPMRNEYGDRKYEYVDNPDYTGAPEKMRLYTRGGDEITVTDPSGENGHPEVYAMDAGKSGALLYQTLLAHASHTGQHIGASTLTEDNALRMLSNTLANGARTGFNPRDVSGTLSGLRPRARGFAQPEEIWRALSGEADKRINDRGVDPDALAFTGEGFTHQGQPLTPEQISANLEQLSPGFLQSKVGPKTLMQSAVYKWLEGASPERAKTAASNWAKVGTPLFSTAVGAPLLAKALRDDQATDTTE
jgi:hypothetical protein